MPGSPTRKRKRAMSPIEEHALNKKASQTASRLSSEYAALLLEKERGRLTNAKQEKLKKLQPALNRYYKEHRPEVLNFSEYNTHVPLGIPLSPKSAINIDDLILPPVLPRSSPNKRNNNNGFASKATKRRKYGKK